MLDSRVERLARVMTEYSLELKPGDRVVISGGALAEPLLRAAYRHTLALGALPLLDVQLPGATEILLRDGTDEQLGVISPLERYASQEADCWLRVSAAPNTRSLSGIDPARQRVHSKTRAAIRQAYLDRAASGALRWSSTVYPTEAYAQDADMSLDEYEDFVFRAEKLHDSDPVASWRAVGVFQGQLIDWLTPRREIHVVGPDTDLRLQVGGRTWINSDGHRNFPSGEVFTGPLEESVEGHVRFTYSSIMNGREVEGVQLWFERGKVVRATAAKNQEFLESMLNTDPGARFLGEFAFGTNRDIARFTGNTLFDEKIGGTVHMALGSGYPDSGSLNRSAIHWDLICDLRQGGEVTVDGEVFVRDGQFTVR